VALAARAAIEQLRSLWAVRGVVLRFRTVAEAEPREAPWNGAQSLSTAPSPAVNGGPITASRKAPSNGAQKGDALPSEDFGSRLTCPLARGMRMSRCHPPGSRYGKCRGLSGTTCRRPEKPYTTPPAGVSVPVKPKVWPEPLVKTGML
jgi:hypothetical protein